MTPDKAPAVLGLILARGGSKRIPGKNIRPLGGKPLLAWTIDAARESGALCDVLLSTDSPEIAETGRRHGAMAPWLRPGELSSDTASSVDAALHALDWYETAHGAVDGLLLLQPTSPFRTADSIRKAVKAFDENGQHPLVSLAPAHQHPAWCFRLAQDGGLAPFLGWDAIGKRSQDIEPAFVVNGAIYIVSPQRLRGERKFIPEDARAFVMLDPTESLDIDTEQDWRFAETVIAQR